MTWQEPKLKLQKNVTKADLTASGFRWLCGNRYVVQKDLYENRISFKLIADLEEREVEYEVYNRDTQNTYYPFYYNINQENDLVCLTVRKHFLDFVEELVKDNILKKEKSLGDKND
jgi:hypothetical protein